MAGAVWFKIKKSDIYRCISFDFQAVAGYVLIHRLRLGLGKDVIFNTENTGHRLCVCSRVHRDPRLERTSVPAVLGTTDDRIQDSTWADRGHFSLACHVSNTITQIKSRIYRDLPKRHAAAAEKQIIVL